MKEKIERLGAEYKLQLEMNKSEHARILENQVNFVIALSYLTNIISGLCYTIVP